MAKSAKKYVKRFRKRVAQARTRARMRAHVKRNPIATPKRRTPSTAFELKKGCKGIFSYLLSNEASSQRGNAHTYVGYTKTPFKRLREHNGELKSRATKRTRMSATPWRFAVLVGGFESSSDALKFEWAWQCADGRKNRFDALRTLFQLPYLVRDQRLFCAVRLEFVDAVATCIPANVPFYTLEHDYTPKGFDDNKEAKKKKNDD